MRWCARKRAMVVNGCDENRMPPRREVASHAIAGVYRGGVYHNAYNIYICIYVCVCVCVGTPRYTREARGWSTPKADHPCKDQSSSFIHGRADLTADTTKGSSRASRGIRSCWVHIHTRKVPVGRGEMYQTSVGSCIVEWSRFVFAGTAGPTLVGSRSRQGSP